MSITVRQRVLASAESAKATNQPYRPSQANVQETNNLVVEGKLARLQTQSGFEITTDGVRELARMRRKG